MLFTQVAQFGSQSIINLSMHTNAAEEAPHLASLTSRILAGEKHGQLLAIGALVAESR